MQIIQIASSSKASRFYSRLALHFERLGLSVDEDCRLIPCVKLATPGDPEREIIHAHSLIHFDDGGLRAQWGTSRTRYDYLSDLLHVNEYCLRLHRANRPFRVRLILTGSQRVEFHLGDTLGYTSVIPLSPETYDGIRNATKSIYALGTLGHGVMTPREVRRNGCRDILLQTITNIYAAALWKRNSRSQRPDDPESRILVENGEREPTRETFNFTGLMRHLATFVPEEHALNPEKNPIRILVPVVSGFGESIVEPLGDILVPVGRSMHGSLLYELNWQPRTETGQRWMRQYRTCLSSYADERIANF